MKIEISAYTLVKNSAFSTHFTDCALDSIAAWLDGIFCDIFAPESAIDETLLDAVEQSREDALKENDCKTIDELREKMEFGGHYFDTLENGNVLIIE